jgi:hypothetical protein
MDSFWQNLEGCPLGLMGQMVKLELELELELKQVGLVEQVQLP